MHSIAVFYTFSILFSFASTVLTVFLVSFRRHVVVKPIFILTVFMVIKSWGVVAQAGVIYEQIESPWVFIAIIPFTTFILTIFLFISADNIARETWNRLQFKWSIQDVELVNELLIRILLLSLICMGIYFLYVSPSQTGLIVAFKYGDPILSRDVREESLKLLPAFPRYAFSFNRDFLAHFGASILGINSGFFLKKVGIDKEIHKKRWSLLLKSVGLLVYFMISASIYGARGPAGKVAMTYFLSLFIFFKAPINLFAIICGVGSVLSIPAILSVLRRGGDINFYSLYEEFANVILPRVFEMPIKMGIWHIEYVQEHGFWGVAGIPKLAGLLNISPANVDNIVMNRYISSETGLASVDAFFGNYSLWGLWLGMGISVLAPWLINQVAFMYRSYNRVLLIPACIVFLQIGNAFNSGRFETIFVTRGLVPAIIVFYIFNKYLSRIKSRSYHRIFIRANLPS